MQIGGCDRICAPESARKFAKNYINSLMQTEDSKYPLPIMNCLMSRTRGYFWKHIDQLQAHFDAVRK